MELENLPFEKAKGNMRIHL